MVAVKTDGLSTFSINVPLTIGGALPAVEDSNIPRLKSTQITLQGKLENGVVHHLADHHLSSNGNDREDLIDGGERIAALLRQLCLLKPPICFIEGYSIERNLQSSVANMGPTPTRLLDAFDSHEIPRHITQDQAIVLADMPLAYVVHYFFPNMKLYGVEPVDRRLVRQAYFSTNPDIREAVFNQYREVIALNQIGTILRSHPPETRVAALIYGANHSFTSEDIPIGYAERDMPTIVKYNFEEWSIFDDTIAVTQAQSESEQLAAIGNANRIYSFAWTKALSQTAQRAMWAKLKANPDRYDSPEDFLRNSLLSLHRGPDSQSIEAMLQESYRNKHGPFSDLSIRNGSEGALTRARGDYAALAVCDELHAFTQLELIRQANKLASFCFPKIITVKGQLEALKKLVPDAGMTKEELIDRIFCASLSEEVQSEAVRRLETGEAPFSTFGNR